MQFKFSSTRILLLLVPIFFAATSALAQNVYIAAPTPNQAVSPGSDIIVDIVRPDFQSSTQEVAIVIALQSCASGCWAGGPLGNILYNGPYDPQQPNPNPDGLQPYETFTVQVPSDDFVVGDDTLALLTVTHMALIGVWMLIVICVGVGVGVDGVKAGPIAWMEELNVTVIVG